MHSKPTTILCQHLQRAMGAQKKVKKSNESINARLALVMKSGKVNANLYILLLRIFQVKSFQLTTDVS